MGLIETGLRDPSKYKDEEWYKAIQKRRLYEEGKSEKDESGLDFLPRKEDFCTPHNFTNFPQNCLLGLTDDEEVVVEIGD